MEQLSHVSIAWPGQEFRYMIPEPMLLTTLLCRIPERACYNLLDLGVGKKNYKVEMIYWLRKQ